MKLYLPRYATNHIPNTDVLNHADYRLGNGSYGEVYVDANDQSRVIKVYNGKGVVLGYSTIREISALMMLSDHPCIPSLTGINIRNPRSQCIQIERYDAPLTQLINKKLSEFQIKHVMYQLLAVLFSMQNYDLHHRDFKPDNILWSGDPMSKTTPIRIGLCDYGMTRYSDSDTENHFTGIVQTLWYRAPEVLHEHHHYLDKLDVWSFGIIIIELLKGEFLLPNDTIPDQINDIARIFGTSRCGRKFGINSKYSNELLIFLDKITHIDPVKRPNVLDLINDSYFNDIRGNYIEKFDLVPLQTYEWWQLFGVSFYKKLQYNLLETHQNARKDFIMRLNNMYQSDLIYNPETVFLALLIFDVIVCKGISLRDYKLHIVEAACCHLACKIHESYSTEKHIMINTFELEKNHESEPNEPTEVELLDECECDVFSQLEFMLFLPTVCTLYRKYHKCNSHKVPYDKLLDVIRDPKYPTLDIYKIVKLWEK